MTTAKLPPPARRILGAALGLLFLALGAAAQNVCVPQASGVPALSGGPNWWDSAPGEPQFWPRPDDPRWRGAFLHIPMPASASADHLTFRALRTGTDLFLQWRITVDPHLDQNERLWVAFSPGPGKEDVYIEIQPFNSAGSDVEAQPPAAVAVATRTAGNPFAGAGVPAWLATATTHTRVWRDDSEKSWTVNMRVPITAAAGAGLNLDPSFSLWFEVRVSHPMNNVVYYQYPNGLDHLTVEGSTNTTGWQLARRDVDPSAAGCIRGVSLTVADVGTVPAGGSCANLATALSSEIKLLDAGNNPATNTFCARPLNETGGTIQAGDVDATFRTANWGTQPDWNDVPNPLDTLWTTINPTAATGGAFGNNAKGALGADWALTPADVCGFSPQPPGINCGAFPAPTRRRHQCMLVELGGAAGVTFSTSSVYRNMDFVDASVFKREAEVSVVGLAKRPVASPEREVYLYVQTNNMPLRLIPPITGKDPDERPDTAVPRRASAGAATGGKDVEPLPKTPYEELRETSPTYQVHAFYDTGRTEKLNDEEVRILKPQTSFGYFVDHKGALYGWRHELQGAKRVSKDFADYYVIPVPENGTATVTTVIEALEDERGRGFGAAGAPGRRRWSLSLHGGINDVRGDAGNFLDGDLSYGVDLQYHFLPALALELYYGVDELDGAAAFVDEVEHLSLNLKGYFGGGAVRPFLLGGVGRYDFTPGGDPENGYAAGAGLQFNLSSVLALEAEGRYHWVDLGPNRFELITGHGVLRISF